MIEDYDSLIQLKGVYCWPCDISCDVVWITIAPANIASHTAIVVNRSRESITDDHLFNIDRMR